MLSDRVKRILVKHEIPITPDLTESRAWAAIYALPGRNRTGRKPRPAVTLCFSGFPDSAKQGLIATATAAGFGHRTSVAKDVTHLCCGPNAGPRKREMALAQGVKIIDYAQFLHMAETGEML